MCKYAALTSPVSSVVTDITFISTVTADAQAYMKGMYVHTDNTGENHTCIHIYKI